MITIEAIQSACKTSSGKDRAVLFTALLAEIMPQWGINTRQREAMFIAQLLHESGEFRYLAELGGNAYLSKYDTGRLAARLGNTPEADGDGQLYKGRGLIQVTGKYNYKKCGEALSSACWYWHSSKLNRFADTDNILSCTKAINGGTNGLEDRKQYWEKLKIALPK